jgi:broad specificity phosphatase PhoE
MHLILLRHGQTESNVIGALDTAVPGAPLTELGQRQAAAVPAALEGQPLNAIFVSTLLRTQQTAVPLATARDLHPTVLDGLREIAAGSLEMLSDHKSQGIYNATAFAWANGDLDLRMPGGETGHEFFARFDDVIDGAIREAGSDVLAVSHGAAIRTWVAARCVNTDGSFAGDHQLDNTAAAFLIEDDGRWRLEAWRSTPLGGAGMNDARAADPVGKGVASSGRGG